MKQEIKKKSKCKKCGAIIKIGMCKSPFCTIGRKNLKKYFGFGVLGF